MVDVLFLDIDGVLLNRRDFLVKGKLPRPGSMSIDEQRHCFDAAAIKLTLLLCEAVNLHVIVCSTWNMDHSHDDLRELLQLPVSGITDYAGKGRVGSVEAYLDEHPEVTNFVIFDDNPTFEKNERLKDHYVYIDSDVGVVPESIRKAQEIFGHEERIIPKMFF